MLFVLLPWPTCPDAAGVLVCIAFYVLTSDFLCADTYAKSREAPYKWHSYNDAHVSEIPVQSICTPEAYLLFYRKKSALQGQ
jgi:hypothetical protein